MKVKKEINKDIFTFILENYNNITYIGNFLSDNNTDNIEYYDTVAVGALLNVNKVKNPTINKNTIIVKDNKVFYNDNKVRRSTNQNLFDFLLTNYGSLNSFAGFISDNNATIDGFIDNSDTVYTINNTYNNSVIATYKNANYKVSTGDTKFRGDFNIDFNDDFNND